MNDPKKVLEAMLDKDNFSRWMGIVVDEYREGYCKLHYTITEEMLNGFGNECFAVAIFDCTTLFWQIR
jgi:acyl-coenzyme A thioesterase PaaI-like protein